MLRQFGPSTWVALLLGSALALFLFVPVAAYRYRKVGRLRLIDLLALLSAAIYFVALWSYTLIPVPENDHFRCVATQLRPFSFIADIAADPNTFLHNRALLQTAFNVVLFVPLGIFLRVLARWGVVATTVAGLVFSLAIESTQGTGVWWLYPCAYRVFDVDDLLLNTLGAGLGALVAIPLVRRLARGRPVPRVTEITLGRRLVGVGADLILSYTLGVLLVIVWRGFAVIVLELPIEDLPERLELVLQFFVPALAQLVWVLFRGHTLGEAAVGLETVAPPGSVLWRRIVKYVFGVGGFLILSADLHLFGAALAGFAVLSLAATLWTRNHRGLSQVVSGLELRVTVPSGRAFERGVGEPPPA